MLLSFRVANHRSLREEQRLVLTPLHASDLPEGSEWKAVPVAGIFGANAAGKSNVLDALRFMSNFVRRSFVTAEPGGGVPRLPFKLSSGEPEPSFFAVDILDVMGVRYNYGFAVDDDRVVQEWLSSYPHNRHRRVFSRDNGEYEYGVDTPSGLAKLEDITADNVLMLSVAARSGQEIVQPVYRWFSQSLRFVLPARMWSARSGAMLNLVSTFEEMPDRDQVVQLLRAADLGLEQVEVVRETPAALGSRIADELSDTAIRRLERDSERLRLVFKHRGEIGEYPFGIDEESLGTQMLLRLAIQAIEALREGSVLAVDEIDASLHPYLSAQLIRLFRDVGTNPHGAQLIFTSHDATLLGRIQGDDVLGRDNIWFVEKDDSGATTLYALTDFAPRKDGENRERRYLTGRYGAVPMVQEQMFLNALAARGDLDASSTSP